MEEKVFVSTKNNEWLDNYWKVVNNEWFKQGYRHVGSVIPTYSYPKVEKIIYNMKDMQKPATIVYWSDSTKTVVVCNNGNGDTFTKEMGVAMCFIRKMMPNRSEFLRLVESGFEQE